MVEKMFIFGRRVHSYQRAQKKHEAKIIISSKVTFLIRCFKRDALWFTTTTESLWKCIQRFSRTRPAFTQQHQRFSAAGPPRKQQLWRCRPASSAGRFLESKETFKHLVLPKRLNIGEKETDLLRQTASCRVFPGWMSERWRAVLMGYLPTGSWRKHLLTVASRRRAAWQVRIVMQKSHIECLEVFVSDLFNGATAASAAPSRQHHVRNIAQCSNFLHWRE